MTKRIDSICVTSEYVAELTGLRGHFTFVKSGRNRVAVFRRLSFLPADRISMIRWRLLVEVEPKVKTSVLNGFFVGHVLLDNNGRIRRGLDGNCRKLLDYLLKEDVSVFSVEPLATGLYRIAYPGDWVEILIARARRMFKEEPVVNVRNCRWHIRCGPISCVVGRFREFCQISVSEPLLLDLLRVPVSQKAKFRALSRPCVVHAFGGTLDVSGSMHSFPESQSQISDRILDKLFAAYEKLRLSFLAGRYRRPSPRYVFPEIVALPRVKISVPPYKHKDVPPLRCSPKVSLNLPDGPDRAFCRDLARRQYSYIKDCLVPEVVCRKIGGRNYSGVISSVDPAIYPPIWSVDHFFNTLAMVDFDPDLAKRMLVGGLIKHMKLQGRLRGKLFLKNAPGEPIPAYPIWGAVASTIYQRTRDKRFLKDVLPLLKLNDSFWDRTYLKDGIYTGVRGFWNDYAVGPGETEAACIAMNSLIALQKRLISEFSSELGLDKECYYSQWSELRTRINSLFWDNEIGGYFDYDIRHRAIYRSSKGNHVWGLNNLLPLFAGIPESQKSRRIKRYLISSDYYGKYPAITTELSSDYQDERRLMIWVMTNWLVIQGLRLYGMHAIADGLARRIFNALVDCWDRYRCLPETLSGTHGLAPMENPNLAGVGCWTGFYLYLKEVYFKGRS